MNRKPNNPDRLKPGLHTSVTAAELRRRAEARLRKRVKNQRPAAEDTKSAADTQRLVHELQVHQLELEMQNTELQDARDRMEILLEKYTDLYDFAPVGYFSLDGEGQILEVNLTGAALLGVERSRLVNQRLPRFVAAASQPVFAAFLEQVFAGTEKQVCEAGLAKEDGATFWASLHGTSAISVSGPRKWCRVAVSDISFLKQAEEAQRRVEALGVANRELRREIVRRQSVERSLRKSEHHYGQLLDQSRRMQEQLRLLSRQLLSAQEEERKKISRELHDVIAQTLTSINVRLADLKKKAALKRKGLERSIAQTQQLVEHSVDTVHQFARELRPTVLDDLGLIPALHTFMKSFRAETGIRVSLSAFAAIEEVHGDQRTVLFRVVQEALNNVSRHARASQAEVKIEKFDGAICLEIKDNGKGFPAKQLLQNKKGERLGLVGMKERLEMVGGKLTISSAPGKGTAIRAQIPLIDLPGGAAESSLISSAETKL